MVPYLRAANVKDGSLDLTDVKSMNFAPAEQQIFSLRFGDVLVTEGSGSLRSVGASAVWRGEIDGVVCFQNTLLRMRPRVGITDGRFLEWWARSAFGSGLFASVATGANIYHISAERVRALPIELPTLEEQRRIADFLDAETARIDRIHDLRTRQQTLLEEAAIRRVYDAVRGAHVKGERKESGLDWLGTVPANWRIGAVSHYFEVELGKMLNQERAQGDYLRPYLRVANVQWDRIDVADLAMMNFPPAEQGRYRLKPGDLLVNEGGSWPGRAAVWNGEISEIYYQKALHRIRARGKELTRWLYYCLVAAERLRVFQVQGNTSTMTHLTREQLRPQRFPFPEIPTQARLVGELDRAASRDAEVKLLLSRQRTLLTERRQALITAAVTGQFDVTTASGRNVTEGVTV